MSCSNCFNGCTDIVSDQCVRYTGIDVPVLGIQTGDSLSYVEQALITFLTSTLDGTGIKPVIDPAIICDLVKAYLPTCGDITVVDLFNALIKAVCDLQAQITVIDGTLIDLQDQIDVIEAPYTVNCLDGVTSGSGTHDIVQAVITKLCAFILDVEANYVLLADLDTLIQAYLDSNVPSSLISNRMVPYAVVEFYPTPAIMLNFSGGVGTGDWANIYLCNGLNGTPDKRGRIPVGATTGMGGGPLLPDVDPMASPFNPVYALGDTGIGTNSVILSTAQIPPHIHATTVTPVDPGHLTNIKVAPSAFTAWPRTGGSATPLVNVEGTPNTAPAGASQTATTTVKAFTGISLNVVNPSTGGGTAHANNQPAVACYYIMYIP